MTDLEDLELAVDSLEGLEELTASLPDLELLLLFIVLSESILLELPLLADTSLLDTLELLSECVLA